MRIEIDHPRTWAELLWFLNADEAEAFRRYVVAHGVIPEYGAGGTIEGLYTDWRVAAAPVPPLSSH